MHWILLIPYYVPGTVRGTGELKGNVTLSLPSKPCDHNLISLPSFPGAESALGQFIHELLSFMEESSVTGHLPGGKVSLSLNGSLLWLYIRILGAAFKTH